jgi:Xaa-Pro aminopeptidase
MLKDRSSFARGCLQRNNLDFLVFLDLANIRYLCGFTGSDGALVVGRTGSWFLTDSRYTTQASLETTNCRVVEYRKKLDELSSLLKGHEAQRVGFEAEHVTVFVHTALSAALPGVELVPLADELDGMRTLKFDDELALLERSAEIASDALLSILGTIRPGAIERNLALELEIAMKRGGADEKSFDFIVASGQRGALPHGRASDKAIEHGDLVTFDFGAIYQGYHSDETVTLAVGTADARQREIYAIVKDAHDRALDAVRPGRRLKELDDLARRYIEAKGYGDYFGHGLGHGVGLEVHEKPVVSFRSDGTIEEGMVFTVEPGIYIPGWGGVRIEDTIAVTADGCRTLTKVPKELMVV